MGKTRSSVTAAFSRRCCGFQISRWTACPNIELVSLLVILYTLEYPRLAVPGRLYLCLCVRPAQRLWHLVVPRSCIFGGADAKFARLMRQTALCCSGPAERAVWPLLRRAVRRFTQMNGGIAVRAPLPVGNRHPIRPAARRGHFVALLLYTAALAASQRTKQLGPQA